MFNISICGTTDLRKSIDWLAVLVKEEFDLDPFSSILFVSVNSPHLATRVGTIYAYLLIRQMSGRESDHGRYHLVQVNDHEILCYRTEKEVWGKTSTARCLECPSLLDRERLLTFVMVKSR